MSADEASASALGMLMLAALYEGAIGVGSGGITGAVATVIGSKRASYYHETINAIDTMMAQPDTTADMRSFLNRLKTDVQQSGLNIDKNAAQELQQKICY